VTREGLRQADEPWERHGFGLWAFRGKADGRFIGRGGLTRDTIDGENEVGLASAVLSRTPDSSPVADTIKAVFDSIWPTSSPRRRGGSGWAWTSEPPSTPS
jgi:hypothetical protein